MLQNINGILNLYNPLNLLQGTLMFIGFMVVMFIGTRIFPGKVVKGFLQPDGTYKIYKLNGLVLFLGTTILIAVITLIFHLSLTPLYTYFWSLFIAANFFAFLWTGILHLNGRYIDAKKPQTLSTVIRDLWFGIELNPTWLGIDLKMFAYQPSLIGLGLLNASFAYVQYETYGQISTQMWMFQVFWWGYLATHYYYEEFMLSTWDIIAEKFGFMLVWGDLVIVPFFYSIIGWYLVSSIEPISLLSVVGISLLYLFGIWMFRGANAQKHQFKKDPNASIWGKPAQTLGGKLLISGWWGIGRKLNYTGEICVYFALSLTTGFSSPFPYLLPLWLCILLPHRAWRDEERCRAKYGQLWDAYCKKARFRMMPFIY